MIKVRIAPSPTGYLHIGTARAALFNWLYAKKHNGQFILRIEDTDTERSEKKYEADIVSSLRWLGLNWDNTQLFRQSERTEIYSKNIKKLLDEGKAFWCHHSKEELEKEAKEQSEQKLAPRHVCDHKNDEKLKNKKGQVIRLDVKDEDRILKLNDLIKGSIEFNAKLLGDLSIARDVDKPLYNLAVVVDDVDMKISHIIRGEDLLSNTPKQLLILEALGYNIGSLHYAHMPMVLGSDRSKLSKRHGSTAVNEYRKDYLADALVNSMAFLGYTYSTDIVSRDEMISEFELEKVHKSGAIFDIKKLDWLNAHYIRNMPKEGFIDVAELSDYNLSDESLDLIRERLDKITDVRQYAYLWSEPSIDKNLLKWKGLSLDEAKEALLEAKIIFMETDLNKDKLKLALDKVGERLGGRGPIYWPTRVALSGRDKSPDPIDLAIAIGKERTIARLDAALRILS